MSDADRVLRPLQEAGPAIDRLETYDSPAVLQEALRATWHAVDRTLRLWLRADPAAPDHLRLSALSEQEMATEAVLTELRRRERISLAVAGCVHELGQAARRAETGGVRAADADTALRAVEALRTELESRSAAAPAGAARAGAVPLASGPPEPAEPAGDEPDGVRRNRFGVPRSVLLTVAAGLILVVTITAVFVFSRSSPMAEGVEAFRAGRAGVAEQQFRRVLARDRDNVSARLYLGSLLRDQGRHQEAAGLLREAATLAPRDAAVRRQLGYLFLDLNRAPAAVEQFRLSVELDPEEPLGWVGLIQALYRAGDPSADEWLRRAPAGVQAMIRTRQQQPPQ